MAVQHAQVTVATTATPLLGDVSDSDNARTTGRSITVQNESGSSIYLGGEGVTSADFGFHLASGEAVSWELGPRDVPYAATASGTAEVYVLHDGV